MRGKVRYVISSFILIVISGMAHADEKLTGDLAKAIRAGDLDAVKAAVDAGADLNALDERKMPPIGAAALLGKVDIVNYLAEKGADVNRNDGFGFTPLMCAAQRGQAGAVRALLKHGADPALKGGNGSDALTYAAPKGPADPLLDEKAAVTKLLKEAIAAGPVKPAPGPGQTAKNDAPPKADAPAEPAKTAPAPPPPAPVKIQPAENSAIVTKDEKGGLGVAEKGGKPITGIKLSQHDSEIATPNIAVAADGTIHVAFVEKHSQSPYAMSAYHRSSSDGGKTWSEAKNLSEIMPNWAVGDCKLLIDAKNRVYVIWRTAVKEGWMVGTDPYAGHVSNLVYRVLENGKWSKVVNASQPGAETPVNGAMQWFAGVDGSGRAQVCWNDNPDIMHPELLNSQKNHSNGISFGLLCQATLDGAEASKPREAFMTNVYDDSKHPEYGKMCDGFGVLSGYFDANGKPHFIADIKSVVPKAAHPVFEFIENGKRSPAIETPGTGFENLQHPPVLLVDAKGNRHVIWLYQAGERQHVRDTVLGSNDEPTIIRQCTSVKGKLTAMEACQGPGGRMVVFMQMDDTGEKGDEDTYMSQSDGGKWSEPINITNNAGRESFMSKQTGKITDVALLKRFYPGDATCAFDKDGHLLVVMITKEHSVVASNVGGATIAGGSHDTPMLQFLKF